MTDRPVPFTPAEIAELSEFIEYRDAIRDLLEKP